MTAPTRRLLDDILTLPDGERAEFAAALLRSLDPPGEEISRADWESSWRTEVTERVARADSGVTVPLPWSEARRQIVGRGCDDAG